MADSGSQQHRQAASEWPREIRIMIWLVQDGDHWQALAADFDVVGQGRSQALALRNLQEHVIEYLDSCIDEGMTYEQALRPIPLREKVRLESGRLMAPIRRMRHKWTTRDDLDFSLGPDGHVHC